MDNIQLLSTVLTVVIAIMVVLLCALVFIYFSSKRKEEGEKQTNNTGDTQLKSRKRTFKEYTTDSIMNFMEFDTVVDNMIAQKNGMRYIMVVECQGVNYDLMSEMEKNSVEEGFVQFLNTIRHPVQIYTQTRTVNLNNSIQSFKDKMRETESAYEKQELKYNQMLRSGQYTEEQLNKEFFELTKRKNLYEYGKDIIYNTERMSLNKNVLNKKYYVIIPYFLEDLDDANLDKEEKINTAFSELYTRAQSVIRTLSVCGVNGKIMTSNELVELLYMAYNRDEADTYGIEKALKAGYDELYSTAPDVLDKQMNQLDKQIEEEAFEKAKQKITEVKSEKQKALEEKRENKDDIIDEIAQLILEENAQIVGQDIAQEAINKIEEERIEREGGTKEDVKQEKTKRTRKTKTA